MSNNLRRSDEPIYWLMFGAGGMIIAWALPALLICFILQGCGVTAIDLSKVLTTWWGTGSVFVILFGIFWHCMHRIYHSLHEVGVKITPLHHYVMYGGALVLTTISALLCLGCWLGCFKIY